ncbi:hypothetical protein ACTWP5_07045 [Streptomyces sp. 4N509B]|uniref:hypothetical protein n=1 Tax=Streptomyces sp. 4N509B TaxID=3457413 RepID=UPI003FD282FB
MSAGRHVPVVTWMVVRQLDWERFAAEHWGREPVRLTGGVSHAGLDTGRAYQAAVATVDASRDDVTFRSGGRAVPDGSGWAPREADGDLDGYLARMGDEGDWLLSVMDPLPASFALWAQVRDALTNLWWRVGWPHEPVGSELAIGRGHSRDHDPAHPRTPAGLLWVLRGGVTVLLRGERPPALRLSGSVGDLLYWPAGYHVAETYPTGAAVALRLALPEGGALPANATERAVGRSAAGLLPAPPPGAVSTLRLTDRIRVTSHLVEVRGAWAVNGHALPRGADRRVLSALTLGRETGVRELCRTGGGGDARTASTLTLLRTLHRLRAVEPVGAADRAEPGVLSAR